MSKKKQKNFNYTPTQTLPKLRRIQTAWNLAALYYKNEHDPRIEKDIRTAERAYVSFAKKWRNTPFTSSAQTLKKALIAYEKLSGMPESTRALRYFHFRANLNAKDEVAQKHIAVIQKRLRKSSDLLIFFTLTLGQIPKAQKKKLLAHKELTHFQYFLERVFLGAKYHLSESEEKIISLKSSQSYSRWVDMTERIVSARTVAWKNKQLAIPEAMETIDLLGTKEKQKLWSLIMDEMQQIGEVAEHEFNAIITDVRTEDELRGYKKPYSATALGYEDSEKSIENLVDAVSTKGFTLSKKFYKLKAKHHGVDTLHYTQKYDSIGTSPEIPFAQAVEICRDVFYGVMPLYGEIFDAMLTNGQIDVYPRAGKRGGAFMSDETNHPTHVFLNHLSNMKSLETLAHEMGHAIHAHRSATQTPLYDGHSITTAETASTLFENLLFNAVYEQATEKEKPVLLHDRITRDIATIQRQIAFFNAELEIHTTIHEKGAMTNEELRDCMYRHLKSYLGPAIRLDKHDGYSYVNLPHIRYGFYVYTYAFGILMSTIMANHYKADTAYVEKIDTFLTAGASDTVPNIFKKIGINTSNADTYIEALKNHEADIKAFEKFTKTKK
ncbi:MAG: M3 family metallopeptidase [Candidatus Pacebacteria bacterium]|nr:M3 family metallopeptidase [Candidatus Paceibacterota bacterium]